MRRIYILDYKGNSDKNGIPMCHSIKVAEEYYNLIKYDFDVEIIL